MRKLFRKRVTYLCDHDREFFEFTPFEEWKLKHKQHGEIKCPYCGRPLRKEK